MAPPDSPMFKFQTRDTANPPNPTSSTPASLSSLAQTLPSSPSQTTTSAQASFPTFPIQQPYSNQIIPGYYPFPMPYPQPIQAPQPAQPGTSSNVNAPGVNIDSPPDFNDNSTLANFLQFAHIKPEYLPVVQKGLGDLGITHLSMFQWFQHNELTAKGVPPGAARSLVNKVKEYGPFLRRSNRV